MNKKYLFAIIVLFLAGLYLGQRFNVEDVNDNEQKQDIDLQALVFHGQSGERVFPFDTDDHRTRVLYFGFTKCPDVCPTSLAVLAGTLIQLDEEQLSKFRPIFISLDPERDVAENTNQFAGYFHPNIEGIVTSVEQTAELATHYGVFYKKVELDNSRLDYTLDHTSYFYFVKPDGTLINQVPHSMTPDPLLNVIDSILTETPTEEEPQ